jgi:integrase
LVANRGRRSRTAQQAHIQWEARNHWTEEGWIFPDEQGGLYDPDRVSRDWARTLKRVDLRPIRLHDLRHCHASHLIRGGATPILVQKRLGHKTIEITLGVYGHLFDRDEQTSIDALADRLYGTGGG